MGETSPASDMGLCLCVPMLPGRITLALSLGCTSSVKKSPDVSTLTLLYHKHYFFCCMVLTANTSMSPYYWQCSLSHCVPTEADKTSGTSPAQGQRKEVFDSETLQNVEYKDMQSAAMSTGDVPRKQSPNNLSELAGNMKKHVDKTEHQFEAGDRPAPGGSVMSKKEKETAITEEFFAQQFQNVTSDHVRYFRIFFFSFSVYPIIKWCRRNCFGFLSPSLFCTLRPLHLAPHFPYIYCTRICVHHVVGLLIRLFPDIFLSLLSETFFATFTDSLFICHSICVHDSTHLW